jgi:lipopolysaccharide export system protein LptA
MKPVFTLFTLVCGLWLAQTLSAAPAPIKAAKKIETADEPLYIDYADQWEYENTPTGLITKLTGKVRIHRGKMFLQSEEAVYNKKEEVISFNRNVQLSYERQRMTSDQLIYYKQNRWAKVLGRAVLRDSVEKVTLTGERAFYFEGKDSCILDSLPKLVRLDTTQSKPETLTIVSKVMRYLNERQTAYAHKNVVITQGVMTATCGEAEYLRKDGKILLLLDPVVTYEDNRMTGDTINIFLKGKDQDKEKDQVDYIVIKGKAQGLYREDKKDSTQAISRVEGDRITSYVKNNEVDRVVVEGKAQGRNHPANDTTHINVVTGKNMEFFFLKQRLDSVLVNGQAACTYFFKEEPPKDSVKKAGDGMGDTREAADSDAAPTPKLKSKVKAPAGFSKNMISGDSLVIAFKEKKISRVRVKGGAQGVYVPIAEAKKPAPKAK